MRQTVDERNQDLIVYVDGELVHRDKAGVSPFDSVVQGGDGVWEGLRLYDAPSSACFPTWSAFATRLSPRLR
jgi:hypothetical protein